MSNLIDTTRRKVTISASQLERVASCPGSWKLSLTVPPQPPGPEAERGIRIHRRLAGESVKLSRDEAEEAEAAWQTANALQLHVFNEPMANLHVLREWQSQYQTRAGFISGRFDLVIYDDKTHSGLVVDYKTGHGDVTDAKDNLQLAAGAVMLAKAYKLKEVYVAIITTWKSRPIPEPALYDEEKLREIEQVLDEISEEANKSAPRLCRGPHCRYCPAITICPETQTITQFAGGKPQVKATEFAAMLPADKLSKLLTEWKSWVRHVGTALEKEAKRRIEKGEEIPGWTLKPGATVREITNTTELWLRLKKLGVPAKDFLPRLKITISDLDKLLRDTLALKGKEAKEMLNEVLDGITTQKQRAETLQQIKEEEQ